MSLATIERRTAALAARIAPEPDAAAAHDPARHDLLQFVARMFPRYRAAAHHERIVEHLEDIEAGRLDRLVITMPPRHGKSELASIHFPAWYLGRNPDRRIIAASYGAALAYRFSRRARNMLADPRWPFPEVTTAGDLAKVESWDIAGRQGGYIAAGVGGAITGMGADLLIIDDPVRSQEDADSELRRERVAEWFTHTALTRLEPSAAVVLIATRWHEADLIGQVLAGPDRDRWTVLNVPAIAEEDDPLGRPVGDALWPERFDVSELEAIKVQIGSRAWASLYQQRPAPAAGGVFQRSWWRHYEQRPALADFDTIIQSWDLTFKETKAGSFVVGQVWGKRGADCYLLDQVRDRLDFPATVAAIRRLTAQWPEAKGILVESKANGPAVVAQLKHEIAGMIEVEPEGGKQSRGNAIAYVVEAGNVHLPHPRLAPWIDDFLEEAASFPNGRHDDQVDAMTQALARLTTRRAAAIIKPVIIGRHGSPTGVPGLSRPEPMRRPASIGGGWRP